MPVGKLTKWRSVPCSTCKVGAGEYCTTGKGSRKKQVRTYVHTARKAAWEGRLPDNTEKVVASTGHAAIGKNRPSALPQGPGMDTGKMFVTAVELLRADDSIQQVSFTRWAGGSITVESNGKSGFTVVETQ